MFTHLHTHSYYSFLESCVSPAELAQAAVEHEMGAVALTDHLWLSGAVEFYTACHQAGVKPLLGLELDVIVPAEIAPFEITEGSPRLVLLATKQAGWSSLCKLSSAALTDPDRPTGIPLTLEQIGLNSSGLICLSGGITGLTTQLIQRGAERAASNHLNQLRDIFPDRLYIELQVHNKQDNLWNARLVALAKRLNLPVVASHNIYSMSPEQEQLLSILTSIRLNKPLATLTPDNVSPNQAYFLSSAEIQPRFAEYPQALEATEEIVSRCNAQIPVGETHFPELTLPEGKSPIEVLRQRAHTGAQHLYPGLSVKIETRLEYELEVIEECGYAPLFLVMEDIVQFASERDIPISSRGSAASSLVAHCLGITSPDPVDLNLYFERFLNPARATPPDIDTDLCSRRRDEVINYVYQRYGQEKVAMVCTISRFRERSALREVAKAYGLTPAQVKQIADDLPRRWYGPPGRSSRTDDPYGELTSSYPTPNHQQIFEQARHIIGFPRHLSIHPGGMVIAPGSITDLVPVHLATKGVIITQFDLHPIEQMGLVKIDLLGIRGLTVLNDVATHAKGVQSGRTRAKVLDFLNAIPAEDQATSDLVRNGRTVGCFQIESPGMRATLQEIEADSIEDIMVALALYRPGPLTGGLKDAFVQRHRGQEPPAFLHPSMEPLLADTYGVILYQEQVLRIANELAGLSLSDADLLRRAMSHFDPGKQMVTLKEKFVRGVYERNAIPESIAERVWDMMAAFAGYGFPKAHAASYAEISWRSAWCKTHFPAIFLAAVLANWGGYYSQRVYLNEARRSNLSIEPPHINYARRQFSVSYIEGRPVLFMGLDQVRELTRQTQKRILGQRPFNSLQDFLSRVDPRPVEAINLIKVGALDGFGTIPGLLDQVNVGGWQAGQLSLFPIQMTTEDWTLEKKVAAQEEILGTSLIAHPLELHENQIREAGAINTLEAISRLGKRVRVAGMRQFWRRSTTRRGELVYIMSLEDLEGMLNVLILANIYQRCRTEISGVGPYIVEGTIELDQERSEPFIRADRIWRLN